MPKINFANTDNLEIISIFEHDNFHKEAYSYETLSKMLEDNYKLKDNDNIFVIKNEDEVLGYIIFHITDDFTDIYKIFIREDNRRNGLATNLLTEVERLARRYKSKKIMIEVRSNNSDAIDFYKKNNFIKVNVRNNYYSDPIDDAIIFEKILEV